MWESVSPSFQRQNILTLISYSIFPLMNFNGDTTTALCPASAGTVQTTISRAIVYRTLVASAGIIWPMPMKRWGLYRAPDRYKLVEYVDRDDRAAELANKVEQLMLA